MGKARMEYIAACTQSKDWRAEMRPSGDSRYPIDLVDPRTGRVLGAVSVRLSKADAQFYIDWIRRYQRERGQWPLIESFSTAGTLYFLWPPDPEEDAANNGGAGRGAVVPPTPQPSRASPPPPRESLRNRLRRFRDT